MWPADGLRGICMETCCAEAVLQHLSSTVPRLCRSACHQAAVAPLCYPGARAEESCAVAGSLQV